MSDRYDRARRRDSHENVYDELTTVIRPAYRIDPNENLAEGRLTAIIVFCAAVGVFAGVCWVYFHLPMWAR